MSPRDDGRMELGFNTEVSYRHLLFHVQTEHMEGGRESSINTLVYLRGTLVGKISNPSPPAESSGPGTREIEERIKKQHQSVLARVRRGEFAPSKT